MTQDHTTTLSRIFSRLCFHAGHNPDLFEGRRERFIRSLACYPEDLVCAAYHHIIRHLLPAQMPTEEDFIAFMQPEYERRQRETALEAV